MAVRTLVRWSFVAALLSLLTINNRSGIDAKIMAIGESVNSARGHNGAVKPSLIRTKRFALADSIQSSSSFKEVLQIRGGQAITKKKKKSPLKAVKEVLSQIAPATRAYLLVCAFCTLVHITGLPAPEIFALDKSKLHEIWRPITSVAYFGAPSMSMANNIYFLVRYGQTLETLNGTGAHAWFLVVQTVLLGILGFLLGFPFQASAMISATVYASSHLNPLEIMPFQFGFMITSWQLPFCMMGIDCLSQQTVAAAWPHLLGIFSGHCFHFFTKVWPALGGKAWLEPPKWFIARFPKRNSNIAGVDFRKNKDGSEESKGKNKKVKKGVGKKLGGTVKK